MSSSSSSGMCHHYFLLEDSLQSSQYFVTGLQIHYEYIVTLIFYIHQNMILEKLETTTIE